jgi:TAG lipase / steryl ester hydrolase / phospholipase A2 / LPA acyltransferase
LAAKAELRDLEQNMEVASNYGDWLAAAQAHDEVTGQLEWRQEEVSDLYDHAQIRYRLDRLRKFRKQKDWTGLLYALNEGIHGNMGGMGKSVLYRQAKSGTKLLIEQYIQEIDDALRRLAELPDEVIPTQQKLDFFYRSNVCYGRSALMLSGGGVLGFLHVGVVTELLKHGLLPRVISGSSAGSIVAAALATHTDEEMAALDLIGLLEAAEMEGAGVIKQWISGATSRLSVEDTERLIEATIPDLTFAEAYAKTGRQVSITVAPAEPHQRSRLLNAVSSPNVYLRSAAMASCAIPGVFPAVMLKAKNERGESLPYLPARRWVDGSVADDLPAKRLSRLFSTNHYIVSMVNPIARAFLPRDDRARPLRQAATSLGVGIGREVLNFYRGVAKKYGENWPKFNMMMHSAHALLDQEYSGDINIVPRFRLSNPLHLIKQPNETELRALVKEGERATYSRIESIRRCTQISRTLEEILHRFEYGDLRPVPGSYRRPKSSRRRPPPTATQMKALKAEARTRSVQSSRGGPRSTAGSRARGKSASAKTSAA